MADNAMARLAFYISLFLLVFSVLMVLLAVQKILQIVLRKRLRSLISEDSQHDLVGREAVVTRTVRSNKAGRIQMEYQGSDFVFKAISDYTLYAGSIVRITSVTPQGFKISKVNDQQEALTRLGDETDQTLKKSVVQDINVQPEQAAAENTRQSSPEQAAEENTRQSSPEQAAGENTRQSSPEQAADDEALKDMSPGEKKHARQKQSVSRHQRKNKRSSG